jgi:exodeoxyribonuclease VIII
MSDKQLEKVQNDDGPKLGIFDDISNEDYHRGVGISKSGLDLINRSPLHYKTIKAHPKPSTPAMLIGSAFHCLVLEPDKFPTEYITVPKDAPRKPTAAQQNAAKPSAKAIESIKWWSDFDKETEGKIVISNKAGDNEFWSPGDWDRIHFMAESVKKDPVASILLDPGQGRAENSVFWIDPEHRKLCKCRPDFINDAHNVCVDLKTTIDASFTGFGKSAASYRYHVQDAFYRDGLSAVGQPVQSFIFVAVEKEPPYAVACYVLNEEAKRVGRIQYRDNLYTYKQCYERDEWPTYPGETTLFEPSIRTLEIATWGLRGDIS